MVPHGAQAISAFVWVAVCLYGLRRGPVAPRILAGALLLNLVEVFALEPLDRPYHVHVSLLVGDVGVTLAALWSLRFTRRAWLFVAIGFQLLSLATHLAKALDRTLGGWGYVTLAAVWGYAVLGCLVAGVQAEAGDPGRSS